MNLEMNVDKVSLTSPEADVYVRIDCYDNDELECMLSIEEFQILDTNLLDAEDRKFFIRFTAKLLIEFWYNGRQERLVVTAEDIEFSSDDSINYYLTDLAIEDCTFYIEDIREIFGEQTIVNFYTID